MAPLSLTEFVEQFEEARWRNGQADVADFLPEPTHPLYLTILCELVRIEMEHDWHAGRPTSLETYRSRFPDLFAEPTCVRELEFEENRLRAQAHSRPPAALADSRQTMEGDPALTARSYRQFSQRSGGDASANQGGIDGTAAHPSVVADRHGSGPETATRAALDWPAVGSSFLGFRLVRELGRGAFARVYLAQQEQLANRPVALKVAVDLSGESSSLAQLQHAHIVPIHSLHRRAPFQAMCMPYFGATTLADVIARLRQGASFPRTGQDLLELASLRCHPPEYAALGDFGPFRPAPVAWETMSYVAAVLWLGARLADGLAHAHERGILHRDLKPANVVLTGDGQPMLVDFNLAQDTKRRGSTARIGGTLPYMAPEQVESFAGKQRVLDGRADVYALGVLLFELLTGRQPFVTPRGRFDDVVPKVLAERFGPPPRLRSLNSAVSPATEAIVQHCLEADPARRYAGARDLQEDLERQLANQTLRHVQVPTLIERFRKWVCRHRYQRSDLVIFGRAFR